MKKLTLTLCAVTTVASAAFAGTSSYSGKDVKQVEHQAPCPTWYADNEFNVGVSGIYAGTVNEWEEDTYLGVDHAWGGAIDAKFFFRRYFGVGVQAFGLRTNSDDQGFVRNIGDDDSDNDFTGGVLGTFTFRYPIPCTRFAPYGWIGAGAIFGGGHDVFDEDDFDDDGEFLGDDQGEEDARLMAQYGGGFEVRFTPHIGLLNDISYNHLEGGHNDFIQVRTGLNFAF